MSKNPYSVLGISENATDEQVKSAYRELAKKYHPDNYQDSPLKDLATEKMKEINEAYDEVQRLRKEGSVTKMVRIPQALMAVTVQRMATPAPSTPR